MRRRVAALAGVAALVVGIGACGVPGAAGSKPSATASAVGASPSAVVSVAVLSSPPASAPIVVKSSQPFASAQQDTGDLQQFVQASATTWWAVVGGNLTGRTFISRTLDAGQHWRDATPTAVVTDGTSAATWYFLNAQFAWLAAGAATASTLPLYETSDGGQSWQQMGTVPHDCTLQFVDKSTGWCSALQGAMGSMSVDIYSTQDGGASWRLISRTTEDLTQQSPGALPLGCDKTIAFTSATVGWASSFCNGGGPYLETTTDGGAHWRALPQVPFPGGEPAAEWGEGLSTPVVDGAEIAVTELGGFAPGASGISASSDGGRSWRNYPLPAAPTDAYWNVDLIDVTHWRATDGDVIMATDDAGAHWRRWTPSVSMHDQFGTLLLDFISATVGSAADPANHVPLWSTTDGGITWSKVVIQAGPYKVQ